MRALTWLERTPGWALTSSLKRAKAPTRVLADFWANSLVSPATIFGVNSLNAGSKLEDIVRRSIKKCKEEKKMVLVGISSAFSQDAGLFEDIDESGENI